MKATIWHNPRCSKSRETLAILAATPGVEVTTIDYLKHAFDRTTLDRLLTRAGLAPRAALRKGETLAKDLDLAHAGDAAVLDAMLSHPILVERPLVETARGVRLCRPPERVREILADA